MPKAMACFSLVSTPPIIIRVFSYLPRLFLVLPIFMFLLSPSRLVNLAIMQRQIPYNHCGALVTTDFALATLAKARTSPTTTPSTTSSPPPPQLPPTPPAALPASAAASRPCAKKKAILQKWNEQVGAAPAAASERAQLDEEIYSIVAKPMTPPQRRRRYPKLLDFDDNGIPVAARGSLKGAKRGRPRKAQQATLHRPRSGNLPMIISNELGRVQEMARSRTHIKMNLRGRRKLENWLSAAKPFEKCTLRLAVPQLDVDMRLLSDDEATRRAALTNMPNEDLRIVEALKLRCETKEGAVFWQYIASSDEDKPHSAVMASDANNSNAQ